MFWIVSYNNLSIYLREYLSQLCKLENFWKLLPKIEKIHISKTDTLHLYVLSTPNIISLLDNIWFFPLWNLAFPVGIYLFKVNNENIRTMTEISLKWTKKTWKPRHWRFIVNFKQISHIVLKFSLVTLTKKNRLGYKDINFNVLWKRVRREANRERKHIYLELKSYLPLKPWISQHTDILWFWFLFWLILKPLQIPRENCDGFTGVWG